MTCLRVAITFSLDMPGESSRGDSLYGGRSPAGSTEQPRRYDILMRFVAFHAFDGDAPIVKTQGFAWMNNPARREWRYHKHDGQVDDQANGVSAKYLTCHGSTTKNGK